MRVKLLRNVVNIWVSVSECNGRIIRKYKGFQCVSPDEGKKLVYDTVNSNKDIRAVMREFIIKINRC